MKVIYQKLNYRIIEVTDEVTTLEDLVGDSYNPDANPDIDKETLASDFRKFMRRYDSESCYGYVVEQWNPEIGHGWENIESCFGFLGQYQQGAENYDHYIVQEYKQLIDSQKGNL